MFENNVFASSFSSFYFVISVSEAKIEKYLVSVYIPLNYIPNCNIPPCYIDMRKKTETDPALCTRGVLMSFLGCQLCSNILE